MYGNKNFILVVLILTPLFLIWLIPICDISLKSEIQYRIYIDQSNLFQIYDDTSNSVKNSNKTMQFD